jgi:hypothetical protein
MGQELIDTGQKPGLSSIESAELTAARRRIAELATELAIAERSTELLKSVAAAKAVRSSRSDGQLPVQTSCQVLEVSESGFYEWRNRPPSERSPRHAWLTQLITEVHVASNGTYGARRVHAELTLGHGIVVGHGCIELLMRAAGVKRLPGNKRARSKHQTQPRAIS